MQQSGDEAFNQALTIAFDNRLGLCRLESERQVFPLTGRYARQFAAHRLALVGDAAHTIHPLAGQGVNLGFGMQGFRDLFAGENPAKKLLRDIGLKLADTLPGVKPQLLRQAMGLNDLPQWLR